MSVCFLLGGLHVDVVEFLLLDLQLLPALQGTDYRQGSDWSKTKNLHQAGDEGVDDEGSIDVQITTPEAAYRRQRSIGRKT